MALPALAPFLIGLVGSIVGRVLVSLGMSIVTIKGVDTVIGQMKREVVSATYALPGDMLSLFLMAGGGVAINLIFAAITFRLTYWSVVKVVRVAGVRA